MPSHRHHDAEEDASLAPALRQPVEGGLHAPVPHREQLAAQVGERAHRDARPRRPRHHLPAVLRQQDPER